MASDVRSTTARSPVTFEDISTANYRIRDRIARTNCDRAHYGMIDATGIDIYFKKDFTLQTGRCPQQPRHGWAAGSAGDSRCGDRGGQLQGARRTQQPEAAHTGAEGPWRHCCIGRYGGAPAPAPAPDSAGADGRLRHAAWHIQATMRSRWRTTVTT